jgi:hypothetical protein
MIKNIIYGPIHHPQNRHSHTDAQDGYSSDLIILLIGDIQTPSPPPAGGENYL